MGQSTKSKVNLLSANAASAITPADSDLPRIADRLYSGGGGTLVVTDMEGTVTTVTLIAGGYLDLRVSRVASASTATGIIAFYE